MGFRFQNFPIYSEIRSFIGEIYIIAESFPEKEQIELASQLRRAANSIVLNLAEGSMKKSDAECNRYILISVGHAVK